MLIRYEHLHRTLAELERRTLAGFFAGGAGGAGGDSPCVGLVNTLPYRRRSLVEVAGMEPVAIELDGFSARTIALTPATRAPAGPARAPAPARGATAIESEEFRVEAAGDGTLTVLDKRSGRRFEQLHRLEDELDMGDLYNFCPVEGAPVWRSEHATARVLRDDPPVRELEVEVRTDRPAGLDEHLAPQTERVPLTATTIVRLIDGIGRIEFRTTIENATRDHRLRALFPVGTGLDTDTVRAEGQFALVHRPLSPPVPRTQWVEPPDATQHTLGVVALGPLALLTKGLPEYEARPIDGEPTRPELCLTLLRAVGLISRPTGAIATRPLGAGPQTATPEGQCLGRHELEYALVPDADTLDAVALLRVSQDYRFGFAAAAAGVHFDSPLSLGGDVVFCALKGAEDGDGLILRCFNPVASTVIARVVGDVQSSRTRVDETGEQPVDDGAFTLGPFEVATVRLRAARAQSGLKQP